MGKRGKRSRGSGAVKAYRNNVDATSVAGGLAIERMNEVLVRCGWLTAPIGKATAKARARSHDTIYDLRPAVEDENGFLHLNPNYRKAYHPKRGVNLKQVKSVGSVPELVGKQKENVISVLIIDGVRYIVFKVSEPVGLAMGLNSFNVHYCRKSTWTKGKLKPLAGLWAVREEHFRADKFCNNLPKFTKSLPLIGKKEN